MKLKMILNSPDLILRVDLCFEFLESIFESIPQVVVGGLFLTLALLQSRSCGTLFILFLVLFFLVFTLRFVFVEERRQVLVLAFARFLLIEALKSRKKTSLDKIADCS